MELHIQALIIEERDTAGGGEPDSIREGERVTRRRSLTGREGKGGPASSSLVDRSSLRRRGGHQESGAKARLA